MQYSFLDCFKTQVSHAFPVLIEFTTPAAMTYIRRVGREPTAAWIIYWRSNRGRGGERVSSAVGAELGTEDGAECWQEECQQLLSVLSGRDHVIVRIAIQLGLRPEELFALRFDDMQGDQLRTDETLVYSKSSTVRTPASAGSVYIPPGLEIELKAWHECSNGAPRDWLFQTTHGRRGFLNANNYRNRVLKPAAIKAA